MHVVVLVAQPTQGATHRDHVIIRVRAEYDHLLRIGQRTLRPIGIVSIRLATRPSRDGMLNIVEDLNVYVIGRAIEGQELAQAMLAVILVGQLQDRLTRQLTQPDDRTTDQLIVPFAAGHQPRMADTCQLIGRRQINNHLGVRMVLQIAGRNRVTGLLLHGLPNHGRLILAPSHQDHVACVHHGGDTHRDHTSRQRLL